MTPFASLARRGHPTHRVPVPLARRRALIALTLALASGCSERRPATPAASDAPATVVYSNDPHDGQPLALVAVSAERCPAERTAGYSYRMLGLWRLTPTKPGRDEFTWSRIQLPSRQATRLRCNELTSVTALGALGPLQVGTYWAVAELDGRRVSAVILSGVDRCQDLMMGTPPSGTRPVCYLADRPTGPINRLANEARAVFAPDPQGLQP